VRRRLQNGTVETRSVGQLAIPSADYRQLVYLTHSIWPELLTQTSNIRVGGPPAVQACLPSTSSVGASEV
jgi:hypothetical protein